jgi:hydrogenase maturation factor
MLGVTEKNHYVTASGARPDDAILLTKSVAIEGTAILATEGFARLSKSIGIDVINKGRKLRGQISVVKEGVAAFTTGYIHAMHDPTEGGLAGGIHELCDASNVGFEIRSDDIPISSPTRLICENLGINPLELISSGSMLISCSPQKASEVIRVLESEGIAVTRIGAIVSDPNHRKILTSGSSVDMPRPMSDALWTALKKISPS